MTKTYSIHVVAAGADYAERVDSLTTTELTGTTDAELLDQAAAIVADRGHVVLRDADGGCCTVDGDQIAITVDPGDLTTEDQYLLGHITTRNEAGAHFTQVYPDAWLARMERLGYISIHRPVHGPTGIPYGPEEWTVEVVQEAVAGWDWDEIEADYAEEQCKGDEGVTVYSKWQRGVCMMSLDHTAPQPTRTTNTIRLANLTRDLQQAMALAQQAAATTDDGGTCNLDGVFLRLPRIKEDAVIAAINVADLSAVKILHHCWYGTGYFINTPPVGQGNKNATAAATMYNSLKAAGWDVSRWCQVD